MKTKFFLAAALAAFLNATEAHVVKRSLSSPASHPVTKNARELRLFCEGNNLETVRKNARDCRTLALAAANATETNPEKMMEYFKYIFDDQSLYFVR